MLEPQRLEPLVLPLDPPPHCGGLVFKHCILRSFPHPNRLFFVATTETESENSLKKQIRADFTACS